MSPTDPFYGDASVWAIPPAAHEPTKATKPPPLPSTVRDAVCGVCTLRWGTWRVPPKMTFASVILAPIV